MAVVTQLRAAKHALKQAWQLTKPYFLHSPDRGRAIALLAAILTLTLLFSYWSTVLAEWGAAMNNALESKDRAVFNHQLLSFIWVAGVFLVILVYSFYLELLLGIRWRRWLTQRYLSRWLADKAFYRIELMRNLPGSRTPDNPDQRIQEDVQQFVTLSLDLSTGLLRSLALLCVFGALLARTSNGVDVKLPEFLGGQALDIPGFLLWVVLLYCGAGTLVTMLLGKPLKKLNFEIQRLEANFRYHLARVRDNAEAIALDQGESVEQAQLAQRFHLLLDTKLALAQKEKRLLWFTAFFSNASMAVPYLVLAERFFSGAIPLGTLLMVGSAFGTVQGALSWLVNNYSQLAQWTATVQRLSDLDAMLQSPAHAENFVHQRQGQHLQTQDLTVALPHGQRLLAPSQLTIAPGETVLLGGVSGGGKSTLLRAFAGIWPFAQGRVDLPQEAMFMPQRPYFPEGRLSDALAYPEDAARYTDDQLRAALQAALLPKLVDRLDESQAWHTLLSGGEQQRLAAARVLLKRPAWVFADEASSALDKASEAHIYTQLIALVREKGGALVSVAHRDTVKAFHNTCWQVDREAQQIKVLPPMNARPASLGGSSAPCPNPVFSPEHGK